MSEQLYGQLTDMVKETDRISSN